MKPLLCCAAILGLATTQPARAMPELVTNGNFDQTTLTTSTQFSGSALTGWTNAATTGTTGYGYNFVTQSGTADTSGFTTLNGTRDRLDGPGGSALNLNYSSNGMPTSSPGGGNYMVSSTDTTTGGAISQSFGNLAVGQTYMLSFYWAAAQFAGTLVSTSEYWKVSFGSAIQSTATVTQATGGFSPWTLQTMSFVATQTNQTLSFLAVGTPGGVPSAGLLDSVSLMAVPEPASWMVLMAGLTALGLGARRRRARGRG